MSIDSQTLNLTGSLKVSGDVKTNVSSKLGVGTDAPQATVHVSNLHPKVLLEETGAALSTAALLYANNHSLNIQVGQEAAADSKANFVFSSYGGQTEHLRIIGSENKVYVPNVLEVSNVEVSNLEATNLSVNVLTIEELTLGVIASLDTVLNTNNQTTNTITTSNVTDSVSTTTGAVVINAGGLGVKSNIHATNVYAETVTANVAATSIASTTVTATSNVTAPNVYVTGMPLATVGSNLVTWDSSTGQLIDSGGLFSNKLSVVSEHPPEAMTSNTATVTDHGVYRVRSSGQYSTNVDYSAFNKSTGTYWVSPSGYIGASNVYNASTQLSATSSTALGEWVSLEIPYKVKLRYVRVSQGLNAESFPTDAKLYGSTDNSAWTELKAWTGAAAEDTHLVNATTAYNYFALVTTKVAGDYDKVSVGDIKLFCESFSVDGGKVEMPTSTKLSDGSTFIEQQKSKKLMKFPRVAMTSTSQDGYVVTTSSADTSSARTTHGAFDGIFDDSFGEGWQSGTRYSTTSGEPITGLDSATFTANGVDYFGQWVKLQLPTKICVKSIVLSSAYNTNSTDDRRPEDGAFLGSNDDTNWELITSFNNDLNYVDSMFGQNSTSTRCNSQATIRGITNTSHYKYIMLVVTKIATTNQYGPVQINELEYYGLPEIDDDAGVGTDVIVRSIPSVPNTDWLEVYWDAGNTSSYSGSGTTVTDLSGNGVTGTITGTNGFDSTYNAWEFDGSGDYIQGTTSIGTGEVIHTWSLWVKNLTPTSTQYAYICGFGSASSANMSGFMLRNGDQLEFTMNGTYVYADEDFPNTWKHVVGVYRGDAWNATNCDIYIDGRKVSVVGTSTTDLNISGTAVNIGSNPGGGQPFVGSIANARLFNRALSAVEVWQLYAYQKEFFDVSPDVVTFKGGRLGIGTSEPSAVLDVRGDIYGGCPAFFDAYRNAGNVSGETNPIIFNVVYINKSGAYDNISGKFTAPIAGYYKFFFHGCIDNPGVGGDTNIRWVKNGTNLTQKIYGWVNANSHQSVSGSITVYLSSSDTFWVRCSGGTISADNDNNAQSYTNGFSGFYLSN
jgi:hypothetical protein